MPNFEEQIAELETVVEQLERGDLALEDSVGLFERGMKLSNSCRAQLASAESRIQVLLRPTENGPDQVEELGMAVDEDEGGEVEQNFRDIEREDEQGHLS